MTYVGNAETGSLLGEVVAPLGDPQTYRNAIYLLLCFPLGLAYLVGLTVGLSLGLGLSVLLIGLPILFGMVVAIRVVADFERTLTNALLGTEISDPPPLPDTDDLRGYVEAILGSRATWMGTAFLFVKLWLGVAGFTVVVTGISLTGALLTAPLFYTEGVIQLGPMVVDTLPEAIAVMPLGVVVAILAVNVINVMADAVGIVATALLDMPDEFDAVGASDRG